MPTGAMGSSIPIDTAAAASSALPQVSSKAPNAPQPTMSPEMLELFRTMLARGSGFQGPMTQMMPTVGTPQQPIHTGGLPTLQVAQGPFGSSGERKRADSQAMLNNLSTFTKSIVDYQHEKKVKEQATTIEKVMSSQSGVVEAQSTLAQAQAALQQNPKDLQAIAAMQRAEDDLKYNKEVLATVGSDPKTAKILEKAFSVKLIGDDKGKASPEYQALQMAIKNKNSAAQKEAGLKMMEKFIGTQPIRQQMSPQYAAYAQAVKDKTIADANEQMRSNADMTKAISEAEQKGYDRESKEAIAQLMAGSKDFATQAGFFRTLLTNTSRENVAEIMSKAIKYRTDTQAKTALETTQWRVAGDVLRAQATVERGKQQSKLFDQVNKEYQRINDEIKRSRKDLENLGTGSTMSDWVGMSKKANNIRKNIENLQNQQKTLLNKMNQMNLGAPIGGTDSTDSGTGLGTADTGEDKSDSDFDRFFENVGRSLTTDEDNNPI